MKHLKKFNENLDNKDDIIEYIKICFVEFYDKLGQGEDGVFTEELYDFDHKSNTFQITMDEPGLGSYDKINEFVRHSEEVAEFYREIENCLEKVAIKYNINTEIEYQFPPEGFIKIIFILGTDEEEEYVDL